MKLYNLHITEDPHPRIANVSDDLKFLEGGHTDLGFENLGLDPRARFKLYQAYQGTGVNIPGTNYHIREFHSGEFTAIIESSDGSETATLPDNWIEAVYVINSEGVYSWIGSKVRPNQLSPDFDFSPYVRTTDGWQLPTK